MKRCRYSACGKSFTPRYRTTEVACSDEHAILYARESSPERMERMRVRAAAKERAEARRAKASARERLKPISKLLSEAQREYNRYVRERDWNLGCISCHMPASYSGQWQAGHYRTTAAAPHLRFDDRNVNKQCSQCNGPKSGNVVEYRKGLILRIGAENVEAIEHDNRTVKWDRSELVAMRKEFTVAWRALRAARGTRAAA